MKKNYYLFLFFFVAVLLISSCKKYNRMLDFNWEDMEIEGNMNWGIPIVNAEYSIGQILNEFGQIGHLHYDAQGDYYFDYAAPQEQFLDAAKFNKLSPEVAEQWELIYPPIVTEHTFENNNVNLATEDMRIIKATLKSGQFKFDFTNNVQVPSQINYDIRVTSHTVYNQDNTPFVMLFSKNNPAGTINCAGLKIVSPDSKLDFTITITLDINPLGSTIIFYPEITLIDVTFKDAEIEILKEQKQAYSQATEFAIFPQEVDWDGTIHNPKLYFDITNTFGIDANLLVSKAYIKGDNQTASFLIHDDVTVTIPKNYSGKLDVTAIINNDIRLTSFFDSVRYECVAIIPTGFATIQDNSIVAAGVSFYVPFDVTLDKAFFRDTISLGLPGLSDLSFFDTVKMRTAFSSTIPLDFNTYILFYNSKSHLILDSLINENLIILGSYDGMPTTSNVKYFFVTNNKLKSMQQADKMIIQLSVNTNRRSVFNKDNYLHLRLGAQIRSSYNF